MFSVVRRSLFGLADVDLGIAQKGRPEDAAKSREFGLHRSLNNSKGVLGRRQNKQSNLLVIPTFTINSAKPDA